MHWTRLRDYVRGWPHYHAFMPYMEPGRLYYTRADRDNPNKMFVYKSLH